MDAVLVDCRAFTRPCESSQRYIPHGRHYRTVPCTHIEHEARKSPEWWKDTPHTAWVWSVKVAAQLACDKEKGGSQGFSAPGSKIMQLRNQSKVYSLTVAADLASASDEPGQALL